MNIEPRIKNPAMLLDGSYAAIQQLVKSIYASGAPKPVLRLAHLRASQLNGCSFCVEFGVGEALEQDETHVRLHAVAAWRESPHFTEAERAVLDLTEHATRLADSTGEPVPDDVWQAAARHFDEQQLAGIVLMIALTNLFNRINATTRQPAGAM